MVAVISVDVYPFLALFTLYPIPDLSGIGYRNRCFLVARCHLIED